MGRGGDERYGFTAARAGRVFRPGEQRLCDTRLRRLRLGAFVLLTGLDVFALCVSLARRKEDLHAIGGRQFCHESEIRCQRQWSAPDCTCHVPTSTALPPTKANSRTTAPMPSKLLCRPMGLTFRQREPFVLLLAARRLNSS